MSLTQTETQMGSRTAHAWVTPDWLPNDDSKAVSLPARSAARRTVANTNFEPIVLAGFKWLQDVYNLVSAKDFDSAIDVLFGNVDGLDSERCDLLLKSIDIQRLEANLMVGVLSITLERAHELPSRAEFLLDVESRLAQLAPDRVSGLLRGLR